MLGDADETEGACGVLGGEVFDIAEAEGFGFGLGFAACGLDAIDSEGAIDIAAVDVDPAGAVVGVTGKPIESVPDDGTSTAFAT